MARSRHGRGPLYLAHGNYQGRADTQSNSGRRASADDATSPLEDTSPTVPKAAARIDLGSPTEQLLAELAEHGEVHGAREDLTRPRSAAHAAIRYGKVPAGQRLVIHEEPDNRAGRSGTACGRAIAFRTASQ